MSDYLLVSPSQNHLTTMMGWFGCETVLRQWAGPQFSYPFDEQSFKADLRLQTLASFALIDQQNELVAFGQYYLRNGRCHLGRLAVSPSQRGKGIALQLIDELLQHGCSALAVKQGSLFVFAENVSAIKAYEKAGFEFCQYPELIPMPDCFYMVKLKITL